MLGPAKLRSVDQPITVSLEALVPADHFYRHLDAKLDLSFVREWVAELYKPGGRPSIDPIVFFKLQLILFFEVRPVLPKLGEALEGSTRRRQAGVEPPCNLVSDVGCNPRPLRQPGTACPPR